MTDLEQLTSNLTEQKLRDLGENHGIARVSILEQTKTAIEIKEKLDAYRNNPPYKQPNLKCYLF